MTTEQQDWNDDRTRRHQIHASPKATDLVELVKKTVTGSDQRDGSTFYKYEKLGVYSSRQAALEAVFAKYHTDLTIQPLQIDG